METMSDYKYFSILLVLFNVMRGGWGKSEKRISHGETLPQVAGTSHFEVKANILRNCIRCCIQSSISCHCKTLYPSDNRFVSGRASG
jgi:hypothetical protein